MNHVVHDGDLRAASGTPVKKVLIVDDDSTVREVVSRYLSRDGHQVIERSNGTDGLAAALSEQPDLVVLDLMMPGMDGLAVCRELRLRSSVPVIMLTALGEESDRVVGLEYGADDYVTKPFSPRELALRVAGVLRRSGEDRSAAAARSSAGAPAEDGDLHLDPAARTVTRGGVALALTVREFDLLAFFLAHRGQVFSRTALMQQVWEWSFGDEATVTVHVRRLREKIEPDPANPRRVVTVWGIGYRYEKG